MGAMPGYPVTYAHPATGGRTTATTPTRAAALEQRGWIAVVTTADASSVEFAEVAVPAAQPETTPAEAVAPVDLPTPPDAPDPTTEPAKD